MGVRRTRNRKRDRRRKKDRPKRDHLWLSKTESKRRAEDELPHPPPDLSSSGVSI